MQLFFLESHILQITFPIQSIFENLLKSKGHRIRLCIHGNTCSKVNSFLVYHFSFKTHTLKIKICHFSLLLKQLLQGHINTLGEFSAGNKLKQREYYLLCVLSLNRDIFPMASYGWKQATLLHMTMNVYFDSQVWSTKVAE